MRPVLRSLLALPAATGLFAAAFLAPALAWSELHLDRAREAMDRWWLQPAPATLREASSLLDQARFTLRRGEYAQTRGQALLAGALGAEEQRRALERSLQAFDAAVGARPRWPDTYAWRAVTRARMGDASGMRADLAAALDRGPSTGRILVVLYPHAGVVAPRLDEASREGLMALADRSARFQPDWVVELVGRFGWLAAWCPRPPPASRAAAACARAGWTPPDPPGRIHPAA